MATAAARSNWCSSSYTQLLALKISGNVQVSTSGTGVLSMYALLVIEAVVEGVSHFSGTMNRSAGDQWQIARTT